MATQRDDLDVHIRKQGQRAEDAMQFIGILDLEDAGVGPLAGDTPDMQPFSRALQIPGQLDLGGAQGADRFHVRVVGYPYGDLDLEEHDLLRCRERPAPAVSQAALGVATWRSSAFTNRAATAKQRHRQRQAHRPYAGVAVTEVGADPVREPSTPTAANEAVRGSGEMCHRSPGWKASP